MKVNKKFISAVLLMAIVFADVSMLNPQNSLANDNSYTVEYNQENVTDVYENIPDIFVDDVQQPIVSMSSSPAAAAAKGNRWVKLSNGYWIYAHADNTFTKNDWECIDGKWYHFNSNGWMQTGWLEDGGYWYHLDDSGAMQIGWHYIVNGWYYFDSLGRRYTGWLEDGGYWYHLDYNNGIMAIGWKEISNKWYYFDSDGRRCTGWREIGGKWYFLDYNNGIMATGLKYIVDGTYYFGDDGARRTGWQKIGRYYYHFAYDNGIMAVGWRYVANGWYYFDSEGRRQTGSITVNGYKYYLDKNGIMQTGWIERGNDWYHYDSDGRMQTGWIYVTNRWFYLEDNGKMRTKDLKQDLRKFWFEKNGDFKGALYRTELGIVRENQKKSNWCWAACASMVGKYNNPTTRTQSDIVAKVKGSSLDNTTGNPYEEMQGIEYVSNDKKKGTFRNCLLYTTEFPVVLRYIDDNKPFIFCMSYIDLSTENNENGFGHAYVCAGYDSLKKTIWVIDPADSKNAQYKDYRMLQNQEYLNINNCPYVYCCSSIVSYEWR